MLNQKAQLHSDVCGPMSTESIGGIQEIFCYIYSRCCSLYILRYKSEVLEKFKKFEAVTTVDSGQRVLTLRRDNGGEYLSNEFKAYLISKGICYELTVPYSPQQNGVAERMNQILMESARYMIARAGLSNHYWGEAVATAAYVKNQMPSTAVKEDQTPYK